MIKVDSSNLGETKQFVIANMEKSGFIYGNLNSSASVSYIKKENDKIVAMANCFSDKYLTYMFPNGVTEKTVREVIEFMQDKPHIGGTVTGQYYDILSEYYNMPTNAINEVATLQVEKVQEYDTTGVVQLTSEDMQEYKQSLDLIKEFRKSDEAQIKDSFDRNYIVGIKQDGKIISSASLTSISDKNAVVVSVFTIPGAEGFGYASKCVAKLLEKYAKGRMILIFFSNPIAKHIYLNFGFEVEDTLIMYNEKN